MVDAAIPDNTPRRHVSGTVRNLGAAPAATCNVKAFDRDLLGAPIELGEAPTDARGAFDIPYSLAPLADRGKTAADLIVKVFDADGELLATSALIPAAGAVTVVDFQVDRAAVVRPDYDRLLAAVGPRLRGVALADLSADDVAYLAAVTAEAAVDLERLAASARVARQLGDGGAGELPQSVIYGWLGQGVAPTASQLLMQPRASLTHALDRAVAVNAIGAPTAIEIDQMRADSERPARRTATGRAPATEGASWTDAAANLVWHRCVARELLPAAEGEALSAADLFGPAADGDATAGARAAPALSPGQLQVVAELLADAASRSAVEPAALATNGFAAAEVALTLRLLALADLAQERLPLVRALHAVAAVDPARPDGSLGYLASLQTDDWQRLLTMTHATRADDAPDLRSLAAAMEERVESQFRTAVVAARVAQNRMAVPAPGRADLIAFFAGHPDFEFGKHSVLAWLEPGDAVRLPGVGDPAALRRNLAALERTFKLTQNHRQQNALLSSGLDSAHALVRVGQRDALLRLGAHPDIGQAAAGSIFARAEHATAVATTLLMAHRDVGAASPVMPPSARASQTAAGGAAAVLQRIPELATLFGSLDTGTSDPCQSVLGPAAYFVDIMKYLDGRERSLVVTQPAGDGQLYTVPTGQLAAPVAVSGRGAMADASAREVMVAVDGAAATTLPLSNGRFEGTVAVPVGIHRLTLSLRTPGNSGDVVATVQRSVSVVRYTSVLIEYPGTGSVYLLPRSQSTIEVPIGGVFTFVDGVSFDVVLAVDSATAAVPVPAGNRFDAAVHLGPGLHVLSATLRSPPGVAGSPLASARISVSVVATPWFLQVDEPAEDGLVYPVPEQQSVASVPVSGQYARDEVSNLDSFEIALSVNGTVSAIAERQDGYFWGSVVLMPGQWNVQAILRSPEGEAGQWLAMVQRTIVVTPPPSPFMRLAATAATPGSALSALLERRPDLAQIELSCENSDIPVPYLDLVLEILEGVAGQPFPHRIALPAAAVDAAARALDAGRVTSELVAAIGTVAPPLSTTAQVGTVAAGAEWTVKDAARRVGVVRRDGALWLAWHAPQTTAGAGLQAAQPEHFNASAYDALATAVFPAGLPFHLWTEDARHHLAHLGVSRDVLQEAFYCGPGWDTPELGAPGIRHWHAAAERLGIDALDLKLISGAQKGAVSQTGSDRGPWNFWGMRSFDLANQPLPDPADSTKQLSTGRWPGVLTGRLDLLLQQVGLAFDELRRLLDMRFVNFDGDGRPILRIEFGTRVVDDTHATVSVDLQLAKLVRTGAVVAGDDAGVLRRMQRFVRLWRKTGWPMADVDRALRLSLAAPDMSARYTVQGTVTDPSGHPVVGLTLQAVDQDYARFSEIGRNSTDARGRYRIDFTAATFNRSGQEIGGPDLSVRALDDQGRVFGKSRRRRESSRDVTIDLTFDIAARTVVEPKTAGPAPQTASEQWLSAIDWTRSHLTQRLDTREFQDTGVLGTSRYVDFEAPGHPAVASPYDRVYLRRSSDSPPGDFELSADGREIRGAGNDARPYVDHIASACGLSASDARRLLDDGDGRLSLRALSSLYFSARAAAVAGGSIFDYIALRTLGRNIPPVQGMASADTQAADTLAALSQAGIPAATATFLLTHTSERDESDANRRLIEVLLDSIRADLRALSAQSQPSAPAGDPDGRHVRYALLRLGWDVGVVDEAMAALQATGTVAEPGRAILTRHLCTFSVVDHAAPLAADIGSRLAIPAALDRRCYYDVAARRLHFVGSMTEPDFAALGALSQDAGFVGALASLRDVRANRPQGVDVFVAPEQIDTLAAMIVPADRFAVLSQLLVADTQRSSAKEAVARRIASAFSFEPGTARRLLEEWLPSAKPDHAPGAMAVEDFLDPAFADSPPALAPTEVQFPRPFHSCIRVQKTRLLLQALQLSEAALSWIFAASARGAGWLDPGTLPATASQPAASLAGLLRLVNLARLKRRIPAGEATLAAIFALAREPDLSDESLVGRVGELTGWNPNDLDTLLGATGFDVRRDAATLRQALQGEWLLLRLADCFDVLLRLRASAVQCLRWAKQPVLAQDAFDIGRVVRARYSEARWAEVAGPMRAAMREKRRDALVSHLVARDGLHDSGGLYGRYLIDVEMGASVSTSRIKQACASVQMFVQRCLLSLEAEVAPSAIDTRVWNWMRNYRVWEANRRVFLYPENWLEPELRDDKTQGFVEFESSLLQGDVDQDKCELAMQGYMAAMAAISRLDIRKWCLERDVGDPGSGGDRIHLFGRTFDYPHVYFHRTKALSTGLWSAWQKIGVQIEGDVLFAIARMGKVYLLWPVLAPMAADADPATTSSAPRRCWEVRLAWTEFSHGAWSAKSLSSKSISSAPEAEPLAADDLNFMILDGNWPERPDPGPRCRFVCLQRLRALPPPRRFKEFGTFVVDFETRRLDVGKVFDGMGAFPADAPALGLTHRDNRWQDSADRKGDQLDLYRRTGPGTIVTQTVLAHTQGHFSLIGDDDFTDITLSISYSYPFVYQDQGPEGLAGAEPGAAFFVEASVRAADGSASKLAFGVHSHPAVFDLSRTLASRGVDELLTLDSQRKGSWSSGYFTRRYGDAELPQSGLGFVDQSRLPELVDFSSTGSYAVYNWELFFHCALYVAVNLSRNQRFEDAKTWFEYIFDPTSDGSEPLPSRYWRFLPFHLAGRPPALEGLLEKVATNDPDLLAAVADWRNHPFEPHRIARLRPSAYQWSVVMKYLDNLIGWADHLFQRDTIESINEATQLYVLAAEILGPRPRHVTTDRRPAVRTFAQLNGELDAFSNVLVTLESIVPGLAGVPVVAAAAVLPPLFSPYFSLPPNDAIEAYWDTVADRLFKIRHSMTLDGVSRQLPLFEPPLDPGQLVRAVAAGVDIGAILQDQSPPLPLLRFGTIVHRALEQCIEVKAMGNVLLSTLERRDGEELARLRTTHEAALLRMVESVREAQIAESAAQREALRTARKLAVARFVHYEKLLGNASPAIPGVGETIAMAQEPSGARVEDAAGTKMIRAEIEEAAQLQTSSNQQQTASLAEALAGILRIIPEITSGAPGNGSTFGGANLGSSISMTASVLRARAASSGYQAGRAGKQAAMLLRENDWVLQRNLSAHEIMQIDQQVVTSEIRIDIATKDLASHRRQLANNLAIDDFMREKYTSHDLFASMAEKAAGIYFQCYRVAYELAKRAERAFERDLALEGSRFIQFGYWDDLRGGLLAGEKLSLDLRRMQASYDEVNRRELEMTKHVSLRRLSPDRLLALRTTGSCEFEIPEWVFDIDAPGQYLRRLKVVSLSIPCVTGPYTGVHCKLTLLGSQIRKSSTEPHAYPRGGPDDRRFADVAGAVESTVTSSASNDGGLFEINLRDERYLPFEGAGAVSRWRVELPKPTLAQFDYDTISDLILHLRYSARDGGEELRRAAEGAAELALQSPGALLVAIRQDFAAEWARALAGPAQSPLRLALSRDMLPYGLRWTTKRRSVQVFNGTRDDSGHPAGFEPLAGDVGVTVIESAIDLGTLARFQAATGGFEPLLLVTLGET